MRFPSAMLLVACLTCPAGQAGATPKIEVNFDSEGPDGQELIHARAEFNSHGTETWHALTAITGYPEHHPWITDARLVRQASNRQQVFLIEFSFPRACWSALVTYLSPERRSAKTSLAMPRPAVTGR